MHVRFHAVCVKSPSNITVRAKTKCSWDLRHINLTNTQKNYKVLYTRACTSRRITLGYFASHSRKSASLARVLNTFCFRTLSVIETWSPHSWVWQRRNRTSFLWWSPGQSSGVERMDFPLRETQMTTLSTLSKQSRKKDSFHSISEVGPSPMRLACILMDSFEHPTFFKKPSSRARPSFSLPWQLHHGAQCAPQMVCTFASSSKHFPDPRGTGRGWVWKK